MSEFRRIIIAMEEFAELETLGDRLWRVPGADEANEMYAGWNANYGGYYVRTITPENEDFVSDAYLSLPQLMAGTLAGVEWDEVAPEVLAELEAAPRLAFLDAPHQDRRELKVAELLRLAS